MIKSTAVQAGPTLSAQNWFAGGERVGYDPGARAIVCAQDAALKDFLEAGGRTRARRLLPAGISRRLVRVVEGSAAFTEPDGDAETLCRVSRHGR
jgi:hypothetical protein